MRLLLRFTDQKKSCKEGQVDSFIMPFKSTEACEKLVLIHVKLYNDRRISSLTETIETVMWRNMSLTEYLTIFIFEMIFIVSIIFSNTVFVFVCRNVYMSLNIGQLKKKNF